MAGAIENTLVFVYGTLMRGEINNHVIGGARYVCNAKTRPEYKMVSMGGFPGVQKDGKTQIHGEVFEVDPQTFAHMDKLEGHPQFYRREEIVVVVDKANALVAWMYILPSLGSSGRPEIKSGDWKSYLRKRGEQVLVWSERQKEQEEYWEKEGVEDEAETD